ncbi:MAG: DNA photolyase family protein [Bacteroidia bacterium]|nr:DNA photolyase family protein [Bacteroidia bacterium]
MNEYNLFWFRRDLRLHDNAGLFHALKAGKPVIPVFIFDAEILEKLPEKDGRVEFIHQQIVRLRAELAELGSDLLVKYGKPIEIWKELVVNYPGMALFFNRDYEPSAISRDEQVSTMLKEKGSSVYDYKDQCIFEGNEVLKDDGKPYTVFTPYSRKWKAKLNSFYLKAYPTENYFANFHHGRFESEIPSLEAMGFKKSGLIFPSDQVSLNLIRNYHQTRDYPAIHGTSKLGVHFRFGTISIREKARKALETNEVFLNELIWRDFYMQILFHFPHVVGHAFKPQYDRIVWRNNEDEFERWKMGQTGYPIVDAGMRELLQTGYMHNRVRMITASFLTKHLLIDWRWGEAWFAEKLLDFELSSNNGGWQWASGSGTDAAPYFRVFNPELQTKKFDSAGEYIRKWVPELGKNLSYKPIVVHEFARKRCLDAYKSALGSVE